MILITIHNNNYSFVCSTLKQASLKKNKKKIPEYYSVMLFLLKRAYF